MGLILKPNWQSGFRVEYEFNTDVFTARDGTENRRSLRGDPRSKVRIRTWREGEGAQDLQVLFDTGHVDTFYVPDPSREATTANDLNYGIDQVVLTSMPDWVVAGAAVVVVSGSVMENYTVESVTGLTVDFTEPATLEFPSGAKMFGAFPSIATKAFKGSWLTATVFEVDLDCTVLPGTDKLPDPVAWPTTFDGLPVFDLSPDWSKGSSITVNGNREMNDFGRGVISVRDVRGFPNQDTQWGFMEADRASVTKVLDFFRLQKGMRGSFYAPSLVMDMTADEDVVSGSSTLRIKGDALARAYGARPYNRAISILLNDGTIIRRKITDISLFDNGIGWGYDWGGNWGGVGAQSDSLITIEGTWGTDVPVEDIKLMSWLRKSRFAADRLTIEWKTSTVATIAVTIRSLRV